MPLYFSSLRHKLTYNLEPKVTDQRKSVLNKHDKKNPNPWKKKAKQNKNKTENKKNKQGLVGNLKTERIETWNCQDINEKQCLVIARLLEICKCHRGLTWDRDLRLISILLVRTEQFILEVNIWMQTVVIPSLCSINRTCFQLLLRKGIRCIQVTICSEIPEMKEKKKQWWVALDERQCNAKKSILFVLLLWLSYFFFIFFLCFRFVCCCCCSVWFG